MSPKLTPKGAATRQRIVEGAAAEIRERGVAVTTLDDVRARTGTSKSQLFHYFPGGRTELLAAVTQHEADRVIEDQRPPIDDLSTDASWRAWQALLASGVRAVQPATPAPDAAAGIILAAVQGGVVLLMNTGSPRYLEAALEAATARLLEGAAP